ncbi:MAG: sugar phosphate isomerase/epimerase family protein [Planctomycetota bacterium]
MLSLSGFTDEIDPDLDQQIRVAQQCGLSAIEFRSVDNTNILALSHAQQAEAKQKLDDAGLAVVSIGSPCGKRPIDTAEHELLDQFQKAIDRAVFFEAPLIRVFSFYPVGGERAGPIEPVRDRAIELLAKQAEMLEATDITMVHENEKGIYGDIGRRCLELMEGVDSPKLQSAFDFANFVQCGEKPRENWIGLEPYTIHIHVKDAKMGSGEVVAAGEGDGDIAAILKDAYDTGYRGYVSMEPHLKVAGHSHGESGPDKFIYAVEKLRELCASIDVPLEGA